MRYRFHLKPRAFPDIREAYEWYEEESVGLGGAFVRAVDECLDRIAERPESFPVVLEDIHRAVMHRYPYGIFYILEEDTIFILALYHTSRDPKGWRDLI